MRSHAALSAGIPMSCKSSFVHNFLTHGPALQRTLLGSALAAAGLLGGGLAEAQDKTMDTVVVTASGHEQNIADAPACPPR